MSAEITSPENITPGNPQTFGRYVVKSLLGEGAMGRVYLAEDPVLQRQLAIKVIALEKTLDQTTRKEYLERFSIEARASAKLSHPSIVAVHDAGQQNGIPWIAFEYVRGEGLDQVLKSNKKLSFERICTISVQIASALHHAHEHKIVHRDVKPANILLDSRTGIAKLTDFGVVKAPWTGLTQSGTSVGSPGYMSPEQIDGSQIDARSDLFSLGVVIYEMITGKHPFVRDTVPATFFATISGNYEPISKLRPETTPELQNAVAGLLAVKRDNRIGTATDLITMISRKDQEPGTVFISPGQKKRPLLQDSIVTGKFAIREMAQSVAEHVKKNRKPAIQKLRAFLMKVSEILSRLIAFTTRSAAILIKRFQALPASTRKTVTAAGAALLILTIAIGTAVTLRAVFIPRQAKSSTVLEVKLPSGLLHRFDNLLADDDLDSAQAIRDSLNQYRKLSLWVKLFDARILLADKEYEAAADSFTSLRNEGGKNLIKNQMPGILKDIEEKFTEGRAPEPLIYLAKNVLSIHEQKRAERLLFDEHYWKRWNMVRVFEAAGKKVDMVKIHILDLQTAGSFTTRIRAAEKLGELGDPRAVPALQNARDKGLRDPFVASAAKDILDRYFKNKKQE
ncbi:MAG: protein kinase [Fibrobacter sp.]|nr:protein kinase [Fibrobacter sp.]